jgi:GNAT superfamily N-acetyltransferase
VLSLKIAWTEDEVEVEGIGFSRLPAMKIAQLGIHKDYNGSGFGKYLITFAIAVALDLKQRVGCRYVTLDAKNDRVGWYEDQGFVVNEKDHKDRIQVIKENPQLKPEEKEARLIDLSISMRLDLHCLDSDNSVAR